MCVTQRHKHVNTFKRTKETIATTLNLFKTGQYQDAIDKVLRWERELVSNGGQNEGRSPPGAINVAARVERLVQTGRLRKAVRLAVGQDENVKVLSCTDIVDDVSGQTAFEALLAKHPPPAPIERETLAELEENLVNGSLPSPEVWEVTASDVEDVCRTLDGSAGVSGTDAAMWRAMLTKYGVQSETLRMAIAKLTTMLGSRDVPWQKIEGLKVCRLIALGYKEEKGYKVRPIGIGEVLARLISQLAVRKTRQELVDNIGIDNLVVGVAGGCEGAGKAAAKILQELQAFTHQRCTTQQSTPDEIPAMLMLDASNAFNRQPRILCLLMCCMLWPSMARYALNAYRGDSLLLCGDKIIKSREGTTQGCPIAGLLYAVGIYGLHKLTREHTIRGRLKVRAEQQEEIPAFPPRPQVDPTPPPGFPPRPIEDTTGTEHLSLYDEAVADFNYADDSAAVGYLKTLASWYSVIEAKGPSFGYHINPDKLIIIVPVKEQVDPMKVYLQTAFDGKFAKANVKAGDKYLGGYVGDNEKRAEYTAKKVKEWAKKIDTLAEAVSTKPQAHYRCLTVSAQHWPTYYQRTVKTEDTDFAPLEDSIRNRSIPNITGRTNQPLTDSERKMFALPARKGGLGIIDPRTQSTTLYKTATDATSYLVGALTGKHGWNVTEHLSTFNKARATHRKQADLNATTTARTLLENDDPGALSDSTKRAFKRAHDHHTSGWLTAVPSDTHGLILTAIEFQDNIALRYGYEPVFLNQTCIGCGQPNSMTHAQSCEVGPVRIMRHDNLKQLLISCCKQATTTNSVHPEQPIPTTVSNRSNSAMNAATNNPLNAANIATILTSSRDRKVDIRVKGLRGIGETDDIDVRITHLDCRSYIDSGKSVNDLFEDYHIKPKRRTYEAGCRQLGNRFTPFVVSTDGVLSEPAKAFLQLLVNKTAEKWGWEGPGKKSIIMALLRAKIGVAIAKGASWCIRCNRENNRSFADRKLTHIDEDDAAELRYIFSSQASRLP